MMSNTKKAVKYWSKEAARAVLSYGIAYPLYIALSLPTLFCFTGRMLLEESFECGNGHSQDYRRKVEQSNIPRALYRKREKKKDEETWAVDPRALAKRRRLSLSDDNAPRPARLERWTRDTKEYFGSNQKRALDPGANQLLRLPGEIREIIWQYAVGNRIVHLVYGKPVSKQP